MRVLIVGASAKPERYAHMAMVELRSKGHEVVLFNPGLEEIEGIPVKNSFDQITEPVDTVSLYVGPERLIPMIDQIISLKPKRIISNPGTETSEMRNRAQEAGIEYIEACTLMMSKSEQF